MQRLLKVFLASIFVFSIDADIYAQAAKTPINLNDSAAKRATTPVRRPKRPKPISRDFTVGLRLTTNGWGIFANKGYVMSEDRYSDLFYDIRLFQVEFSEIKHTKETKRANANLSGTIDAPPTPFIFGKINNFYMLKLGYGFRKMIAGKPEPGNISVHLVYMGGLSAGLLKPYYIQYGNIDPGGGFTEETIRYSDSTKTKFISRPNIIGGAGFSRGLSEIEFVPGVHAKTGLHFDFANDKRNKLAVETGFELQYYAKEIELMVGQDPTAFFISFYASVEFGKRK